jgi:hypothetical protein
LRTRTASDSLAFSESVAQQVTRGRAATEVLTFADIASRGVAFRTRTAAESLSYSDAAVGVFSPFISSVGILDGGLAVTVLEGASASGALEGALAISVIE